MSDDAPTRTGSEPEQAAGPGAQTVSADTGRTPIGSGAADGNGRPGSPPPQPRRSGRRLALPIAIAALVLVLIAGVVYWRLNIGLVKTDNAQTSGDVAPVSSQVTGTVTKIDVADNRYVKAGTVLVELDRRTTSWRSIRRAPTLRPTKPRSTPPGRRSRPRSSSSRPGCRRRAARLPRPRRVCRSPRRNCRWFSKQRRRRSIRRRRR